MGGSWQHSCRFANLAGSATALRPGAPGADDGFDRLFPDLEPWHGLPAGAGPTLAALEAIAEARHGSADTAPDDGADGLPAGYSYLLQLVIHDLTFMRTVAPPGTPAAGKLVNYRSPRLDLDCVYGDDPVVDAALYERPTAAAEARYLLRLGSAKAASALDPVERGTDLPRLAEPGPGGQLAWIDPIVADVRNDVHLILSQLTLLFMRVHNRVAALAVAGKLPKHGKVPAERAFEIAQRFVVCAYRNIVAGDLLDRMLDPEVWRHCRARHRAGARRRGASRMTRELALAGARCGHALTRNRYHVNDRFPAQQMAELTAFSSLSATPNVPVPADWRVDWRQFFELGDMRPQLARRFTPLYCPDFVIRTFTAQFHHDPAPVTPIRRAASLSLLDLHRCWETVPSGQDCAGELKKALPWVTPLASSEMWPDQFAEWHNPFQISELTRVLRDHEGFLESTPLSYYLLQEAAVRGGRGARLGPLGSYIVAEAVLRAQGGDPIRIRGVRTMPELIRLLAVDDAAVAAAVDATCA